ncbi:MAG: hypothetical protein R3314_14780 [Longimicrobiales bacterium]|nr:hypothetical protein [Longimicrobiales bacterium]
MRLASRGLRDMDDGPEAVDDPAERAQLRRQARIVHLNAAVTAAGLTALALMVST